MLAMISVAMLNCDRNNGGEGNLKPDPIDLSPPTWLHGKWDSKYSGGSVDASLEFTQNSVYRNNVNWEILYSSYAVEEKTKSDILYQIQCIQYVSVVDTSIHHFKKGNNDSIWYGRAKPRVTNIAYNGFKKRK